VIELISAKEILMNAKKKGSTLVELLAVLVISSIFFALLAPAVYNIATNAPPTAARKGIASRADPAESPGEEVIAADQSHNAGSANPRNP
jgi:prepilin-type N-terminal cleavage/methylation domain-containing protein